GGEASRLAAFVPAVQASNYNMYFHSDAETPSTVPAPGLAATTRAYVKIIEDVNTLELSDVQLPPPTTPTRHTPTGALGRRVRREKRLQTRHEQRLAECGDVIGAWDHDHLQT